MQDTLGTRSAAGKASLGKRSAAGKGYAQKRNAKRAGPCTSTAAAGGSSALKACAKKNNAQDTDNGRPAAHQLRRSRRCNTGGSQSSESAHDDINLFKNRAPGPKPAGKPPGFYAPKPGQSDLAGSDVSVEDPSDQSADLHEQSSAASSDDDDDASKVSYSDDDLSQPEPPPDEKAWRERVKVVEDTTGVPRERWSTMNPTER